MYRGIKNELKTWILLDNQSTTDIFCNKSLLKNIHEVDDKMTIETNGGTLVTKMQGFLKNYGKVWYHPAAITNILSLSNVKSKYRVTFDSAKENKFIVHKPNELVYFIESSNGLYYHDTKDRNISMLNTVEENKLKYFCKNNGLFQ